MPWLLAKFVKKQQDKFNQMNGFGNSNTDNTKEGEVHIKTKNHKSQVKMMALESM